MVTAVVKLVHLDPPTLVALDSRTTLLAGLDNQQAAQSLELLELI